MKLVVFDLDQTLVDFISVHNEATRHLFLNLFGVEARLTDIDFAGRRLMDNFKELVWVKNIPPEKARWKDEEVLREYTRLFEESLPADVSRFVLPGARPLLEELAKAGHLVALYTGSSAGITRIVLRATGLAHFFNFSVHGEDAPTRAGLLRLAIAKAEGLAGREFRYKNVVVIGDSVRDIEAGKECQALTIAVATGFHSLEMLRGHRPDYLFHSMEDYPRVLRAIEMTKEVEVQA